MEKKNPQLSRFPQMGNYSYDADRKKPFERHSWQFPREDELAFINSYHVRFQKLDQLIDLGLFDFRISLELEQYI